MMLSDQETVGINEGGNKQFDKKKEQNLKLRKKKKKN